MMADVAWIRQQLDEQYSLRISGKIPESITLTTGVTVFRLNGTQAPMFLHGGLNNEDGSTSFAKNWHDSGRPCRDREGLPGEPGTH